MVELLSPAGNFEKLKAALHYGADAVYCAGKAFGMRAAADNFTPEELYEATAYAHSLGKKLYLTLNTLPSYREYEALEKFLCDLQGCGIDALIIADPGVLELARKTLPDAAIHISTQAGAVSHADCEFWAKQGASRVVLARELSFEDIAAIRARTTKEVELEIFIHGSMCVSFSGRCLLSANLTGRSADKGECTQPCRWHYNLYEIEEETRPGQRMQVIENDLGSFILSSKDLCTIEHIPELISTGAVSFKIEGRMKSAYYAAVTANAYRMAIDAYTADPSGYVFKEEWKKELESVSHREYCSGFFLDVPGKEAQLATRPGYIREKTYLAVATGYDEKTGRAFFIQKNKAVNGARAELLTPGQCGRALTLDDMQNENGEAIESAPHPFMPFSVKVPFPVKEGDILRGAGNES